MISEISNPGDSDLVEPFGMAEKAVPESLLRRAGIYTCQSALPLGRNPSEIRLPTLSIFAADGRRHKTSGSAKFSANFDIDVNALAIVQRFSTLASMEGEIDCRLQSNSSSAREGADGA